MTQRSDILFFRTDVDVNRARHDVTLIKFFGYLREFHREENRNVISQSLEDSGREHNDVLVTMIAILKVDDIDDDCWTKEWVPTILLVPGQF